MINIPDVLIKSAIRKVIKKSNESIDFFQLITKEGSALDLNKKLVIMISDMDENTGLGVVDSKLVELEKISNPDTIFAMNKQTFSAILLNKTDHRRAYFMGAIEATGENYLRDSILLGKIFDEIKIVLRGD